MRIKLHGLVEQLIKSGANPLLLCGLCNCASLLGLPLGKKVCKLLMNQGTRSCHHFAQAELTAQTAGQWRIKLPGFVSADARQNWKMDLETSDELCESAVNESCCR